MVQKNVFLVAAIFLGWANSLEAYFPFEVRAPLTGENQRAINDFYIPGDSLGAVPVDLARYRVFLHPLLVDYFSEIERTRGEPRLPDFLPCSLNPVAEKSDGVHKVNAAVENYCRAWARPETLFVSNALFRSSGWGYLPAMTSLEDNLDAILTPLEMQGTAFSWFGEVRSQAIRKAIFRLGFSRTEERLRGVRVAAEAWVPRSEAEVEERERFWVEVTREEANLNKLRMDAKAEAAADIARLPAAIARALPYPELSGQDRVYLSAYVLGMLWRFRGGGMVDEPTGTQDTRVYFAERPIDVVALLNGLPNAGLGSDHRMRLKMRGWGEWFDLGHVHGAELEDLIKLTYRGIYQLDGTVDLLQSRRLNPEPALLAGRQFSVCYLMAWERLGGIFVKPGLTPPFQSFYDGPTAWGETCVGALIGLGISEAVFGKIN